LPVDWLYPLRARHNGMEARGVGEILS